MSSFRIESLFQPPSFFLVIQRKSDITFSPRPHEAYFDLLLGCVFFVARRCVAFLIFHPRGRLSQEPTFAQSALHPPPLKDLREIKVPPSPPFFSLGFETRSPISYHVV